VSDEMSDIRLLLTRLETRQVALEEKIDMVLDACRILPALEERVKELERFRATIWGIASLIIAAIIGILAKIIERGW